MHPWTKYEVARLRDEDRLRASRAAIHLLAARRRRASDLESATAGNGRSWLERFRRREEAAAPSRPRGEAT